MEYRRFGTTGRDVSVIGCGAWAIGADWGTVDDADTLTCATGFEGTDYSLFDRHGESFDVGETFAEVDDETGLAAAEEMRALVPAGATLAQLALRWILVHPAIPTTILGAKTPEQARADAAAAGLQPLDDTTMAAIREIDETRVRPLVHQRW